MSKAPRKTATPHGKGGASTARPRCESASDPTGVASPQWRLLVGLICAVVAVVVFTHWPILQAQALSFDDAEYLTENPLVKNPGWGTAWRFLAEVIEPSSVGGYYQPLTMISLMLDCAMGGTPEYLRPFHRTSLALHTANTVLVIVLLYLLFRQVWVAVLAGLLFGVHPMTVEPIAWVGDRKTTLAAFFALWCLVSYLGYVRSRRRRLYICALASFVLALMSKPTTTLLPLMLLLLDFWPLRRLSRGAVLEKVPFLLITGISAIITVVSQGRTASVGLPTSHSGLPIVLGMCHKIVFYPSKIIWPSNLTSFYPQPSPMDLSHPQVLIGVAGTCVLIALLLISLRWTRALLTGWLMFFVVIFPTLGGIGFTLVIASDKYAYLPAVGLLTALTWGLALLWQAPPQGPPPTGRRAAICAGVLILAFLAAIRTREYVECWRDTESLHRHMIKMAPGATEARCSLGHFLFSIDRRAEAIEQYQDALRVDPNCLKALNNLGYSLTRQHKPGEAVGFLERAIKLKPEFAVARYNLGEALLDLGRIDEAIDQLTRAIELHTGTGLDLRGGRANALNMLGIAVAQGGNADRAVECFREALQINPDHSDALCNLANAMAIKGNFEEAIRNYRRVLREKPDDSRTHANLANALAQHGQTEQAIAEYAEAIRLDARNAEARCNLGVILQQQGRRDDAIRAYREALAVDPAHAGAKQRLSALLSTATSRSGP